MHMHMCMYATRMHELAHVAARMQERADLTIASFLRRLEAAPLAMPLMAAAAALRAHAPLSQVCDPHAACATAAFLPSPLLHAGRHWRSDGRLRCTCAYIPAASSMHRRAVLLRAKPLREVG